MGVTPPPLRPGSLHLTPTADLIGDVLAARHRLGESFWEFDRRVAPALQQLLDHGLITYDSDKRRASLTARGQGYFMDDGYLAPVVQATFHHAAAYLDEAGYPLAAAVLHDRARHLR